MTTAFPPGFFARQDDSPDSAFYAQPRLVTHIDAGAIAAVSDLYTELGLAAGDVLDLMSSWVSHFAAQPATLTALGMNADELAANPMATDRVVHDLNANPALPFADASFDAVTCCVSIDYLTQPVAVLAEVARVLRPGGTVALTFSNRCFPTKAVRGWFAVTEDHRPELVATYVHAAGGFEEPQQQRRRTPRGGDPLWAVWARRHPSP